MPRHANKRLHKLRFYCQPCNKQCTDEHGFSLHTKSPSHIHKQEQFSQYAGEHSLKLESEFMKFLNSMASFKTGIGANKAYNDFIKQEHTRMTSTNYKSLTMLVYTLAKKNKLKIVNKDLLIVQKVEIIKPETEQKPITLMHEVITPEERSQLEASDDMPQSSGSPPPIELNLTNEDEIQDPKQKVKPKIKFKLK